MQPNTNNLRSPWIMMLLLIGVLSASPAAAQQAQRYHQPLSQHTPPGKAAGWLNYLRQYDPAWLQPMQVELPGGGNVQVYSGSTQPIGMGSAPAIVAASAGHLYRLRISDMPEFPGIDLYPTIELLDRLHPPQGLEDEFPIPILFTADDIRTAINGQLVTRIIYLEQPQIAQSLDPLRREIPQTLPGSENALQEADRLGRPMAVIRIGGRRPSGGSPPSFFGTGGAVQVRPLPVIDGGSNEGSVRMNAPAVMQRTSAVARR